MRLTHAEYAELVKRRPHLAPMAAAERKQDPTPALAKAALPQRKRKSRVEVLVAIVACRPGCLDSDSLDGGGTKALRDAIAESLGYDDGDARIRFEYGQLETVGDTGTIVKIQVV